MGVLNITAPERDIIIAALRLWQGQSVVAPVLKEIATNADQHPALSNDEIDNLIEGKLNVEDHAEDFVHVGTIDVDAGSIWIGDPCYVLQDKDKNRPADLGENWHDICNRFFERSGYRAVQKEWSDYQRKANRASSEDPSLKEMFFQLWETRPAKEAPDSEHQAHFADYQKACWNFEEKWKRENPFTPESEDSGVASFKHDLGHEGMGLMMSTNFGDGSYPVYVKYAEGRPSLVLIDFFGEPAEDCEEDEG